MAQYRLTESLLVFPEAQEVVPTPNTDNEAWKNLISDVSPRTFEDKLRLADGASYMASRGPDGIDALLSLIKVAKGQDWLKLIRVHGAVANNWHIAVKLLLTHPDVKCDVNAMDRNGYTPLHFAVIWGRPGMAVLLLSLGADFKLETPEEGLTPYDMARQRLNKLLAPRLNQHDDIKHLRAEGEEIVKIFEGVGRAEGYVPWAEQQINNRHVLRHSPFLIANAQRLSIVVLREMVMQGKAFVLDSKQVAEKERLLAEKKAAEEKLKEGPPMTLEEGMKAAGLLDENPKVMMRQMHKLLEVRTLDDLKKVTREDVAELDELTPAERRSLWLFASQHHGKKKGKSEDGSGGGGGGGGGGGDKPKKSKKKKSSEGDLDSLLSEGVKPAKTKKAVKSPSSSSSTTPASKPSTSASTSTSANNATNAKQVGQKAEEDEGMTSSLSSLNLSSDANGKKSKDSDKDKDDYRKNWSDPQSATQFIFRHDLPSDAFSVIIKMIYS